MVMDHKLWHCYISIMLNQLRLILFHSHASFECFLNEGNCVAAENNKAWNNHNENDQACIGFIENWRNECSNQKPY